MERKRRMQSPDGREVEATEVGFRALGEHWNEYLLDDGTLVRLKLVATTVLRIEGSVDQKGQPAYAVESTNVISVSAPEKGRP